MSLNSVPLRSCLTLLVFLSGMRFCATSQPVPMSREECAYTRGAAEYVFSILDEPASRMGSDEEKLHYTQNATLRTLLVFRICPSVGEKVLDNNSKLTGHWIKNIENTMDGPDIDYLEQSAKKYPAENTIHLLVK